MKTQKTKNFGVLAKKINNFLLDPKTPLRGLAHLGTGSTKKLFFTFVI
jgi:hypothetical protein